MFEADRRPDIAVAIDILEQLGFRRFAMHGLCSGAYHALHATLADRQISQQVLVSLPLFQWWTGDAIELLDWATESRIELLLRLLRKTYRSLLVRKPAGQQATP